MSCLLPPHPTLMSSRIVHAEILSTSLAPTPSCCSCVLEFRQIFSSFVIVVKARQERSSAPIF